jgi:DNA-directed RNA polymerase subunit RPC12/RpoP
MTTATIPATADPIDPASAARAAYRAHRAVLSRLRRARTRRQLTDAARAAVDAHTCAVWVLGAVVAGPMVWRGFPNGTATWTDDGDGLALLYSGRELYTAWRCADCGTRWNEPINSLAEWGSAITAHDRDGRCPECRGLAVGADLSGGA